MTKLRNGALVAWGESHHLASEAAMAERLGVDRTLLNRVRRGEVGPSGRFIAAVLAATGMKFEALFEIAEAS